MKAVIIATKPFSDFTSGCMTYCAYASKLLDAPILSESKETIKEVGTTSIVDRVINSLNFTPDYILFGAGSPSGLPKNLPKVPIISMTHDSLYLNSENKKLLDISDGLITNMDENTEEILRYKPEAKVIRMKLPYVAENYNIDLSKKEDVIISIGRIVPDKGHRHAAQLAGLGFEVWVAGQHVCFPSGTAINIRKKRITSRSNKGFDFIIATKPINEIVNGDEVLSYNSESGNKEWDKVISSTKTLSKEILSIEFSNHNLLRLTPNHPVFVHRKGWIEANKLSIGDIVVQYNYLGLNARCRINRSYEQLFGGDAQKYADNLSESKFAAHKKVDSPYNDSWKEKLQVRGVKSYDDKYGDSLSKILKDNKSIEFSEMWEIPGFRDNILPKLSLSREELWKVPEYRNKALLSIFSALPKTNPNGEEEQLDNILQEIMPNEFKYNGNFNLGISINGKILDFVNVNGKKKAVEFYGCKWHCCSACGCENSHPRRAINDDVKKHDADRINGIENLGWQVLVVWGHELNDIESLKQKLLNFLYNPNSEIVKVSKISYSWYGTLDIGSIYYKDKHYPEGLVYCGGNGFYSIWKKKNYFLIYRCEQRIDAVKTIDEANSKIDKFISNDDGIEVYNLETEKNHNYFAYGILVHNCHHEYELYHQRIAKFGAKIFDNPTATELRLLLKRAKVMMEFTYLAEGVCQVEFPTLEAMNYGVYPILANWMKKYADESNICYISSESGTDAISDIKELFNDDERYARVTHHNLEIVKHWSDNYRVTIENFVDSLAKPKIRSRSFCSML